MLAHAPRLLSATASSLDLQCTPNPLNVGTGVSPTGSSGLQQPQGDVTPGFYCSVTTLSEMERDRHMIMELGL